MSKLYSNSVLGVVDYLKDIDCIEHSIEEKESNLNKISLIGFCSACVLIAFIVINIFADEAINNIMALILAFIAAFMKIKLSKLVDNREKAILSLIKTKKKTEEKSITLAANISPDSLQTYLEDDYNRRDPFHVSAVELVKFHMPSSERK